MTLAQFKSSLHDPQPPDKVVPLLKALWHDARNDWNKAHQIAQDVGDADGAWVHAYLHRKEGDSSNASYWYRQAKKPVPTISLADEWEEIVNDLLIR